MSEQLATAIDQIWEQRDRLSAATTGETRSLVEQALDGLDDGTLRVAEPKPGGWVINQWLKKAVLLSFRLHDSVLVAGPGGEPAYDKVPLKFAGWHAQRFAAAGFRAVPGAVVRRSAYIAPGVVLMPSFVNVGAHVGRGTMIDTWATVGSCAQIGSNCHISGGAGIGGVLEPLQAEPVVIEDDCFVGARSEVAEGGAGRAWQRAGDGGVSRRIHQDHRPRHRRGVRGSGAGLFGGGAGIAAGPGAARRVAGAVALLRRDRQAGRCADPLEDVHQRAAAGLSATASDVTRSVKPPTDPVPLAQALIRCASVTPADDGAQAVLADALERLGFRVTRLRFGATENFFARIGAAGPHFCFAGHTDVVPAGAAAWQVDPFAGELRDGVLYGRGACDMKGGIAAFVAACADYLAGGSPAGSISLLITGDEEGDASDGTTRVLDWMAAEGQVPDFCLVGEPTNPGAAWRGDQNRAPRQPQCAPNRARHAGPFRLSAARRQSGAPADPRAGGADRGTA